MYVNFSSTENHTASSDKTKTNEWLALLIKIKGRIEISLSDIAATYNLFETSRFEFVIWNSWNAEMEFDE